MLSLVRLQKRLSQVKDDKSKPKPRNDVPRLCESRPHEINSLLNPTRKYYIMEVTGYTSKLTSNPVTRNRQQTPLLFFVF